MSFLITETTKEEREKIVEESLGNISATCDGCMSGLAEMYQDYIDGKKELKDINMEFNARYVHADDRDTKYSCPMQEINYMELMNGRPADCAGRIETEIACYDFLDSLGVEYKRIDHEDVLKGAEIGMHPCINTSSIKMATNDLIEKVIPAMNHEYTVVSLPRHEEDEL